MPLLTLAGVITIRQFQANIKYKLVLRMRISKLFHHDSRCCLDIQKIKTNYTDSCSKFEFENGRVANYLPID